MGGRAPAAVGEGAGPDPCQGRPGRRPQTDAVAEGRPGIRLRRAERDGPPARPVRRPLPADLGAPEAHPEARLVEPTSEVSWLQPMPDLLFAAAPSDPATVVVQRQTMRLALIGALQQLPPRQRAVLILRDVLQWRTTEVAELLQMTAAAVNSALQRARAQVPLSEDGLTEPAEPRQRALLDRYVTAFETEDVDQLVTVLTED